MCVCSSAQALQDQLTSSVQEIGYLIDPVSTSARGEAAQLGHKVRPPRPRLSHGAINPLPSGQTVPTTADNR